MGLSGWAARAMPMRAAHGGPQPIDLGHAQRCQQGQHVLGVGGDAVASGVVEPVAEAAADDVRAVLTR